MKNIFVSVLFLIFIFGELKSKNDSLKTIHHSFNFSASLSGEFNFIGLYNPAYRLYYKKNIFQIGPNLTNSYLSLVDIYQTHFQLSGFSLGYRHNFGEIKKCIFFSYAVDGIYNYLNEKIIVRRGSIYELYFGLETEAKLTNKIYLNASCGAGVSYCRIP